MKKADDRHLGAHYTPHHHHLPGDIVHPWEIPTTNCNDNDEEEEEEKPFEIGLFRQQERAMFTQEIIQQVVIGMGRLDVDFSPRSGSEQAIQPQADISAVMTDNNNPYFPPLPPSTPSQPQSHVAVHHAQPTFHDVSHALLRLPASSGNAYSPGIEFPLEVDPSPASSPRTPIAYERSVGSNPGSGPQASPRKIREEGEDEQATMGRLSSMSLMAAVTASGNKVRFSSTNIVSES
ncbi:hypothetical protein CPB84DRAFT_1776420 [Gymnopilus junonius]|uniref:Uncharacterized protein n=1 Tax=Gymnopilus junonius TaxID=109634 RepID=A0A9P5TPJ8_GYMJU|nr:hypothetical protein CPB84DRAFT_1776420 [Gymnopilus junonius]